jgi:hypothetical protein
MTISLAFGFAWNCKGGRSFGKQMPPPRCFQSTCATHWPSELTSSAATAPKAASNVNGADQLPSGDIINENVPGGTLEQGEAHRMVAEKSAAFAEAQATAVLAVSAMSAFG